MTHGVGRPARAERGATADPRPGTSPHTPAPRARGAAPVASRVRVRVPARPPRRRCSRCAGRTGGGAHSPRGRAIHSGPDTPDHARPRAGVQARGHQPTHEFFTCVHQPFSKGRSHLVVVHIHTRLITRAPHTSTTGAAPPKSEGKARKKTQSEAPRGRPLNSHCCAAIRSAHDSARAAWSSAAVNEGRALLPHCDEVGDVHLER